MAQKINKISDSELLALGEKQEVIKKNKKQKKNLLLPILLMIIGLILMLIGIFYNNITVLMEQMTKKPQKVIIKDDNILTCNKKIENETLGLNEITKYTYTFKDKKLQTIKEVRTIKPMEYSDIGPNNVNVIGEQYKLVIANLKNINGLDVTQSLKDNKLVVTINTNLKEFADAKIPPNDKINVIYTYDEELKSVKQKIAHSGDVLCE